MRIKTIKKTINHNQLNSNGWKLFGIHKGFLGKLEKRIVTLVLIYKKIRYCENVEVGCFIRYYNRFGLICEEQV